MLNQHSLTCETVEWQAIASHISEITGHYFEVQTHYSVTSGHSHEACRIEGVGQNYFVKFNSIDYLDRFIAEVEGLKELSRTTLFRIPTPLCYGTTKTHAYLVMQYITLRDTTQVSGTRLGEQLAALHRITHDQFGWHRSSYVGATFQSNTWENDWVTFWQTQRLGVQLALAVEKGYGARLKEKGEHLIANLGNFFGDYKPVPSLLHGNLWLGNYAVDVHGQTVLLNPAVYYGDRETDLAMTELLGGFPHSFYQIYQEIWPLDPGYAVRKNLYNLYHILNCLNSFGGSYLKHAEAILTALLSELH